MTICAWKGFLMSTTFFLVWENLNFSHSRYIRMSCFAVYCFFFSSQNALVGTLATRRVFYRLRLRVSSLARGRRANRVHVKWSAYLGSKNSICIQLKTVHSPAPLLLVIVLTKAAPAVFVKWSGEYFVKWLRIGNNRLFFSPFFFFVI